MYRKLLLIYTLCFLFTVISYGQVRIRIFSAFNPGSAVFRVTSGNYELHTFNGPSIRLDTAESVLVTRFNGKLAVKTMDDKAFLCDSAYITGSSGKDFFSVRINNGKSVKQNYTGDLRLYPDLGTILMINVCSVESYIAGVVKSEGGPGRNREYVKTQAIFARTYMYKYFGRHLQDRFNLCDDIHCQAFHGITTDTMINSATRETRGLVILDRDSNLVISAFHSNCGGETSVPEDVWLTSKSYLKSINDPYCTASNSARWERKIPLGDWVAMLKRSGYSGSSDNPEKFRSIQETRKHDYQVGSFSVPFNTIRSELNLRSAFFSVIPNGNTVVLKGKGYGHGVGLCQEGAMVMARKGHTCRQIIDFYYSGVIITDIRNALILHERGGTALYGGGM
jgi:stage II sporulation protein D